MPGMHEDEYRRAYHRAYQSSVMAESWVESHARMDREVRASLMQMRARNMDRLSVPPMVLGSGVEIRPINTTGGVMEQVLTYSPCLQCRWPVYAHWGGLCWECHMGYPETQPRRHGMSGYRPYRSVKVSRDRPMVVEFPMIFMLGLGIGALFRLIKHITKNTAISWYEGHVAICSWLRDTGEPSRADGLRVLGAVSYLGFWLVTCVVWAISLVSAVLL